MTAEEHKEWSKYIYGLLGCDYWVNLSMGAVDYLNKCDKNNKTAEHDFLEDLSYLDVSICDLYWNKQTIKDIANAWLKYEDKDLYDPIKTRMMQILYLKLWPDSEYQPNMYHPCRFYAEFGIKPDLETFEKIKGEQVGGWVNAWDNPQKVLEIYNSLVTGIVHPSRQETQELLESNQNVDQIRLF